LAVVVCKLSGGSWSLGIMGDLTSSQADLDLFPLTLTPERAAAISCRMPYTMLTSVAGWTCLAWAPAAGPYNSTYSKLLAVGSSG